MEENIFNKLAKEAGYTSKEYGGIKIDNKEMQDYGRLHEKYGESEWSAGFLGAFDSLTFGTGSGILTRLGLVDRETVQAIKKFNPKSYAVGEIGTDIATILWSLPKVGGKLLTKAGKKLLKDGGEKAVMLQVSKEGGEKYFKKGAREKLVAAGPDLLRPTQGIAKYHPTALVDQYSDEAGEFVSKYIQGDGSSKVRSALGGIVGSGTRVGLDNAALGIRTAFTDTAIEDKQFTIDRFAQRGFTNAKDNFMGGMLFGGGFGSANLLVKLVGNRGKKLFKAGWDKYGPKKTFREFIDSDLKRQSVDAQEIAASERATSQRAKDRYDHEPEFIKESLVKDTSIKGEKRYAESNVLDPRDTDDWFPNMKKKTDDAYKNMQTV